MNRYWTSKRRKNRRKRLRKDHGENCRWCGVKLDFDTTKSPQAATVDHLTPVSQGGSNRVKNTVLACRACNNARGDMPWKVWARIARGRQNFPTCTPEGPGVLSPACP